MPAVPAQGRRRPRRGRERDVLERGEVGEQVRALEDVGDAVRAERAAGGRIDGGERPAAPLDRSGARLDEPAEHVQQRRLARSRAAEEGNAVPLGDLQVDVLEGVDGRLAVPVANRHLGTRGERLHGQTSLPSRSSSTRSAASATRGECVTTTTVVPNSSRRRWSASRTMRSFASSSSAVGSSASTSGASRGGGRDRDPLLLAAGESRRPLVLRSVETEEAERLLGGRGRILPAPEAQRERDVLVRRQLRPEVAALEDDRDSPAAVLDEPGLVEARERSPEHPHLAGRRLVQPGRELQRGALPGARRPEERDELAGLDAEVEPAQRDGLHRPRAVDLEDVVELERPEADLLALLVRLAVEARYLHRKLSIISR